MQVPVTASTFGDSLTADRLGIGYCQFLTFRFSKQDRSGWTFSAIVAITIEFLRNHTRKDPGAVIFQAVANDLLISHMMRIDSSWASYGRQILKPLHPPLENDDSYQEHLLENDLCAIAGDERRALNLSQERGLMVTIDGVHPNGHVARAIAAAIESTVNSSMVECKKTSR